MLCPLVSPPACSPPYPGSRCWHEAGEAGQGMSQVGQAVGGSSQPDGAVTCHQLYSPFCVNPNNWPNLQVRTEQSNKNMATGKHAWCLLWISSGGTGASGLPACLEQLPTRAHQLLRLPCPTELCCALSSVGVCIRARCVFVNCLPASIPADLTSTSWHTSVPFFHLATASFPFLAASWPVPA